MSPNDVSNTHGNVARDEDSSSMVAKLAKELDGVLDLNNTEDVKTSTTYAPAVTKEVVKPVVHEQIEEHITRETHTHDHYTKILPVRDVEVLPARHWVPGPDGRLIQVDEKDVYSGAAFSQGQASTAEVVQGHQHVNLEQTNQGQVNQTRESHSSQHADTVTVTHTSVNQPKVVPAQVNQVYQTQVHQPELDRQYVSVGQVDHSQISHGSHRSSIPVAVSHREVSPSQTHQTQVHEHGLVSHREVSPSQTHQTQTHQTQTHQSQVHQHDLDQHQIPRKPVDYGHTQGYITPLRQQTDNQDSGSKKPATSSLVDQARQSRAHRHTAVEHDIQKHQANHSPNEPSAKRHEGSQGQVQNRQVEQHQADQDQLSPGLLDPYRVKNGPTHHDPFDPTSKPLPDLPETSVQKIAGHKILTTEDNSGHTRLHKEPKDSKRSIH
ncbi:hypothetical protein CONLIGDRAFT_295753 [Coniochaeta ligniaria NRRL 30616]|uniref:Uncharacterized protein n=1 Tax=Coniochaeta ligniaria NRRL 30616 TaxID=1408157 RepID=A0A1J7JNS8_9PEZI|nr:hypothetical protein CONLIGDRAFT_295753 [Coniochaeta ligniaria NRRL 30616]